MPLGPNEKRTWATSVLFWPVVRLGLYLPLHSRGLNCAISSAFSNSISYWLLWRVPSLGLESSRGTSWFAMSLFSFFARQMCRITPPSVHLTATEAFGDKRTRQFVVDVYSVTRPVMGGDTVREERLRSLVSKTQTSATRGPTASSHLISRVVH